MHRLRARPLRILSRMSTSALATGLLLAALNGCAQLPASAPVETLVAQPTHARNVILFLGDGMGISTITAARILEGQLRGESGEENLLEFETLPQTALIKTYNTNQQTPDSAGTMSAIMTGHKTRAGVISVGPQALRGDCAGGQAARMTTLLELAEDRGLATGVVSTARITHATPAATYAHVAERDWENDQTLPREAREQGCTDIARQLVEFDHGDGLEVALGGGRSNFMQKDAADPEYEDRHGSRADGRDLIEAWMHKPGAAYVWNQSQFDAVNVSHTRHLLGLFEPSHMQYSIDRAQDSAGEPSLAQMTAKAIAVLQNNPKGFFLMVEGGRIDHAHHAGNAQRALTDTIAFAKAVQRARELTHDSDTLILVTADHSHVLTMAGYPTRGNPILGKVIGNDAHGQPETTPKLAKDGQPYTTLSYANGRGAAVLTPGGDTHYDAPIAAGRTLDLQQVDTTLESYHQQALVPLSAETHGGEDVALFAGGPGSQQVHGVLEQNRIFDIMRSALGL